MVAAVPSSASEAARKIVGQCDSVPGVGPVKSLLDQESFDQIHLLSDYTPAASNEFASWLDRKVKIHVVAVKNPSDHGALLDIVRPILQGLRRAKDDELAFHLSPGTPAMGAIWILLGKSQFPATLYQTYNGKAWKTEIPFDITTDVLPDLLREPDRYWQHLATRTPQEVSGFESIVGKSEAIKAAVGRAQRAAIHDVPVLILGESGTGKEMFAEAIHKASHRGRQQIVSINCAAISRELLESELFGHVKGAFTGADKNRIGAFEEADGGTLFLDEIGECDLAMQAKLLRALQPPAAEGPCCRIFRPVGAMQDKKVDVRIIAATNRDLTKAIADGAFREDLLYRLSIVTLKLPPLRQRPEDIAQISKTLLIDINVRLKKQGGPSYQDKSISADTIQFMQRYPWPGNVRELSNALVQAAMMADSKTLKPQDIAAAVAEFPSAKNDDLLSLPLGGSFVLESHLLNIQRHFLRRAMLESDGKVTKAAKLLGYKNYQTLSAQLERLGVEFEMQSEAE
ncbi:Transcriptional regulatory protein ZraR [Novipirellula artificiosorum]|uniref:Transcriptional regulatory protein ZraR n=2 Tax=Novipirellula artificiosorum TaxID=2528016 RepID=A0A5C6DDS6_9BACT|nr:Transcriptional regulatory protein ZraR [Novipirellula artificiosorum]